MLEKLSILRSELEEINNSLFSCLENRSKLVYEIQKIKGEFNKAVYDKSRELELFKRESEKLSKLNNKQLLIYSLLIENDANQFDGTYPAWSSMEHLESCSQKSLSELTNPMLLALFDKKSYSSLNIKPNFQVDI